ncbi:MAG: hypothetical protein KBF53_14120 [Sphingobium sp.]|nr:hypothetical protein [Sphingobium sp.]
MLDRTSQADEPTGAQIIPRTLADLWVQVIFGYPARQGCVNCFGRSNRLNQGLLNPRTVRGGSEDLIGH